MLVRSRFLWQGVFVELWPVILVITIYSIAVSFIDAYFHLELYHLPISIATMPAAFVGVLLAFRTNSSYGRWWEARMLWGAIVNDSRTWVRQLMSFVGSEQEGANAQHVRQMSLRQVAWCRALTRSLRRQDPHQDFDDLLGDDERQRLHAHANVPNALLLNQAADLRTLRDDEAIDTWEYVTLERTLVQLTNSMGGCERIRNTPFPPHYSNWVHYLIYLTILMLPLTFVDAPAVAMIFVTVAVSSGFLIVEKVAMYLETPFAEPVTGTPMSALSRTIEINIRQMLGDAEVPSELQPENDVLY